MGRSIAGQEDAYMQIGRSETDRRKLIWSATPTPFKRLARWTSPALPGLLRSTPNWACQACL